MEEEGRKKSLKVKKEKKEICGDVDYDNKKIQTYIKGPNIGYVTLSKTELEMCIVYFFLIVLLIPKILNSYLSLDPQQTNQYRTYRHHLDQTVTIKQY